MDLADASLVALAEERDDRLIFTLDAHFRSYRLRGRRHLRVVPDMTAGGTPDFLALFWRPDPPDLAYLSQI
jgi:hypothetical protein